LASTEIPYYKEAYDRDLQMIWGMKGIAREQIVTVASAVKGLHDGVEIEGDLVSVADDEEFDEDD